MSKIAIIVLNWNGLEDTKKSLASLFSQSYKDRTVILVENGSTEAGTSEGIGALKRKYPDLVVLENEHNTGFAGGVNTGIRYALKRKYDFVALFNNDAVADKHWLQELLQSQQEQSSGITTGLLLHADGETIDSTGDWCSVWGLPFPRDRNKPTKDASASGFVFSGSGGASLYSMKMLREIGMFDEGFFAYYEDTDISFRAQLYGWRVYYTDKAIAYHEQGASSGRVPGFTVRQTFKNLPLFVAKNMPSSLLWKILPRFWLAYILMAGNAIKHGNGMYVIKGYFEHLVLFWCTSLWQRFEIQRAKKVDDSYIESILWPDLPPDQTGLRKFRDMFRGKK